MSKKRPTTTWRKRHAIHEDEPLVCFYCDFSNPRDEFFQIDHVIPKSKGGSSSNSNLVVACYPCNKMKASMDLDSWISSSYFEKWAHPGAWIDLKNWSSK